MRGAGENPIVFEIALGEVDKGGDISDISQYPGEREVLFPPMTNLEVQGLPRLQLCQSEEGLVCAMVLSIRANVSLSNLTLEQLYGKRKALFIPTLENVLQEVRLDLAAVTRCHIDKHDVDNPGPCRSARPVRK